jgi:hypothetical protein
MVEKLLILIVGTLLGCVATVVGTVIKTWLDRRTYTSNHLFELRIEALNRVWQVFNEMKDAFGKPRDRQNLEQWKTEHGEQAKKALERFRSVVDSSQIVLDREVIDVLRRIDSAYFLYLNEESDRLTPFGQWTESVKQKLQELTETTNQMMSQQRHSIALEFRT